MAFKSELPIIGILNIKYSLQNNNGQEPYCSVNSLITKTAAHYVHRLLSEAIRQKEHLFIVIFYDLPLQIIITFARKTA